MSDSLILLFIQFILGVAALVKGADLLTDGASQIAKKFGVPEFVIGLTLVAFGTSLPELTVNVIASLKGNSELTMGNVIGSNIANILLILGVSSVIYPLKVHRAFVKKEIPINFIATLILIAMANDILIDGKSESVISRSEGLILVFTFLGYLYFMAAFLEREDIDEEVSNSVSLPKGVIFILLGILGLTLGSNWTVDGAVGIATALGVSQMMVGLFLVAVGTSLPELLTSAVAALKRNPDIALGNVAGSNIFNISLVLGVSSSIKPVPVVERANFDLSVLFIATLILLVAVLLSSRNILTRREGTVFLLAYIAYIIYSGYVEFR